MRFLKNILILAMMLTANPIVFAGNDWNFSELNQKLNQIAAQFSQNLNRHTYHIARDSTEALQGHTWILENRQQYEHLLLKIAQVQMYLDTQYENISDYGAESDLKAARPLPRIIKCQNKAFQTNNRKISDSLFCAGILKVAEIQNKARKNTFFREAVEVIFGDDFFHLSHPDQISRVVTVVREIDHDANEPFFFLQVFKREVDKRIAEEARRKRDEQEQLDEILRSDREAFRRERAEWRRERIDRESYRLGVWENRRHIA